MLNLPLLNINKIYQLPILNQQKYIQQPQPYKFLLVQLLVPAKRGQITPCYSITGQGPSLAIGMVIPPADSKSGQGFNTGWRYFMAAVGRKNDSLGNPRFIVPGIRSQIVALEHTGETCRGSVDFANFHVGECGQKEVLWASKSLSTYLRAS